jgi:hypothetical protein
VRKEKIIELIKTQIQLYPNTTEMDGKALAYYASAISDIEDQYLVMAFRMHLETNKWFPSVSEIRAAAAELAGRRSGIPIPFEAWREVMDNAKQWVTGNHRSVDQHEWSHPLVKEAARLMGWEDICYSTNIESTRARFLQAYEQLKAREEHDLILSKYIHDFARPQPSRVLPESKRKPQQLESGKEDKPAWMENGWANMPQHIKDKFLKTRKRMEIQ